ncbi:MAG: DUF4965 domain-containing protein [Actinobacteria bacterium]|nr:DUF4965 domain-containing protein [Actinomycetota bacterium]
MLPLFLLLSAGRAAAGDDRLVVELSGLSWSVSHAGRYIAGTDNVTRQPYKYKQERYGPDFHYSVSGLRESWYDIEFSFFESTYNPGERIFSVYANGIILPGLANLDLCALVGRDRAHQVTVTGVAPVNGEIDLHFVALSREATVSNIRFLRWGDTVLEINVMENRRFSAFPLRFVNGPGQDLHEVVLGRLGSRFMVNPVPQLLAWRQSPYGTWSDDLSELVLAFRDAEGDIRCLPFTDRYPVFSSIDQEDLLTGVSYTCRDPSLPFEARVTLRAPFYPGDVKLSSAPFVYLEVAVENEGGSPVTGDFLLVRAHKDLDVGGESPQPLAGRPGYRHDTRYTYGWESYVRPDPYNSGYVVCGEAVAAEDDSGFAWHYDDITSTGWIWDSPPGYPPPYAHGVYTFRPKGYSGLTWSFSLPAGGSEERRLVFAGHTSAEVLNVRGDTSYRFLYNDPAGPDLGSVEEVVEYALAERAAILEKTSFVDDLLSGAHLSPFPQAGKDLMAYALQSFLSNTWWCYNSSGEDWFSVWEGTSCMFHSTIDLEYNAAWFYLTFWPDLLGKLLREWPLFEKSNAQGKYLSHDMGVATQVTGMAYPHDMPVEENTNYVLLLHGYWKHTGDTALMRELFPRVRDYVAFVMACDTDSDGLPDINTSNTIDQGSDAVQHASNQTYLGVKALAAYRAAAEMAAAQASPDQGFIDACDGRVVTINLTMEKELWTGDHFVVCSDPDIPKEEREAYSIYASNGLLYLLASGLDAGITSTNLERLRQDILSSAAATERRYGHVHTSVNNENQWVSQDLWRDALGYYLGSDGWPAGQEGRLTRYRDLQYYFATKKNGGFWDVCDYGDFYFLGTSEAVGLGFADAASATSYLAEARLEAGGVRGAYSLDSAYHQSLGYYPRGTTVFCLLEALARLRVDLPGDRLLYDPAHLPGRVPVLACADWGAADPAARIPVLVFDAGGALVETVNRQLLPSTLARSRVSTISGLETRPFSCSPREGSTRPAAQVSYSAPPGSVSEALVLQGTRVVRHVAPGSSGFSWDGRDDHGQPLPDGVYTVYLKTDGADPSLFVPPALVEVGVNVNVPSPSTRWYLAEGYTGSNPTGGDFETWITIQNPNDQAVNARVVFMQPGGTNTERRYLLSPRSRFTLSVDAVLPQAEVSTMIETDRPVVAERAMYFSGRRAGHCSVGADALSTRWYLAEGYTGGDFDEWVLIQNPNDAVAEVFVRFQTQGQGETVRSFPLPPRSRFTIHVDALLPDAQVSTFVSSYLPVVVERAQYLNHMRSGSCSLGARSASTTWYLAEGYTGGGFEEWICIQNPQDAAAKAVLTFMQPDGTNSKLSFYIAPRSRYTVAAHSVLPGRELATSVLSDLPVVVERAMYWKGRSDGHATLASPCPEYTWYFAEGYTAEGFEEWVVLQNPWERESRVQVTFMFPDGGSSTLYAFVKPRSRFTLNVGSAVGAREVSVKVSSRYPVVAERAMYFLGRSGGHCSIGAIE